MPVSIVSTLYKSAPHLAMFITRCLALMMADDELVLVDDGSPDSSIDIAREFALSDRRITVVQLSRNFGHHRAILAGLGQAVGDRVFFVDSDLEEAPELLREFSVLMEKSGADVVFGIHEHSHGALWRRMTSRIFWRIFNWASETETPLNICNVRLMSRPYVDALLSLPENNVFLGGLFHWVGFVQIAVPIQRSIRNSPTSYSLINRSALAVRSIVSFSNAPLKAMFVLGVVISALSTLLGIYYAIRKIVDPTIQLGFTSLIISMWFLSGVIVACLGVIGIYLAYMYAETKRRPRVVIKEIFRLNEK
jgi:putative glycosyltransferase